MSKPNTTWLYNNTANDGANTGGATGGAGGSSSNWVVMDLVNDRIMFLDDQQMDGDSRTGTKYPVIIPDAGSLEAPKTFVDNLSDVILDQVPLAGTTDGMQNGGNTRYVFAIYFDGATVGVPYLEAWDSSAHLTAVDPFLGGYEDPPSTWNESAADSTLIAVATTLAAPGSATWAGTPLAGVTSRVTLDSGPIVSAKSVYFNIKHVIPSTFLPRQSTAIVLTLRYLYS